MSSVSNIMSHETHEHKYVKNADISSTSLPSDFWTLLQLAQPARLLLEYTGTKYENKFYVCGEGDLPVQLTNQQLS